jgi:hypothetical protein
MKNAVNRCESLDLHEAIRQVYANAGMDRAEVKPGIVPLYELIGAYPITVTELPRMTYRTAIEFLIAEVGNDIAMPNDADRSLSGLLYAYEDANYLHAFILTEKTDGVPRRRFTAAHELGHYVRHFLPLLESRHTAARPLAIVDGISYTGSDEADIEQQMGGSTFVDDELLEHTLSDDWVNLSSTRKKEQEANEFAAEILMPAEACHALAEQYTKKFGKKRAVVARCLAPAFLVSQEAMQRRLKNLGLLEQVFAL